MIHIVFVVLLTKMQNSNHNKIWQALILYNTELLISTLQQKQSNKTKSVGNYYRNEVTTEYAVGSWNKSWNKKRTFVEKMVHGENGEV